MAAGSISSCWSAEEPGLWAEGSLYQGHLLRQSYPVPGETPLLPLNAHYAKARHLGGAQNAGFFPACLPGSWPLSPLAFWVRTCFVLPPLACLLTQAPLLLSPPCSLEPSTATLVPSAAPQHLRRVNWVGAMCVAPGASSPGFSSWLDALAQCPRVSLISSVKQGGG